MDNFINDDVPLDDLDDVEPEPAPGGAPDRSVTMAAAVGGALGTVVGGIASATSGIASTISAVVSRARGGRLVLDL